MKPSGKRVEMMELTEMIPNIRKAFAGVTLDGGVSKDTAYRLDDHADEVELELLRKKDAADLTPWEEIEAKFSIHDPGYEWLPKPFLDPKGFRYHLPVYLIWSIKDAEAIGAGLASNSTETLIYALCPLVKCPREQLASFPNIDAHLNPGDKFRMTQFAERFEILTSAQKKVTGQFLLWARQQRDLFEDQNVELVEFWIEIWNSNKLL